MRPDLIETIRIDADGRMPLLPLHLERLYASAEALSYANPVERAARLIAKISSELAEGQSWRLRLLATDDGQVRVEASPLAALPAGPLGVCLAPWRLDSRQKLLRHKTTHRPWYANDPDWLLAHPECFDRWYLNERDEWCEGSRSNLYARIDGRWYTPPLSSGCLAGVQRAALLDDEDVFERVLTLHDLRNAEALRLSNALRGWCEARWIGPWP